MKNYRADLLKYYKHQVDLLKADLNFIDEDMRPHELDLDDLLNFLSKKEYFSDYDIERKIEEIKDYRANHIADLKEQAQASADYSHQLEIKDHQTSYYQSLRVNHG